MRYYIVFQCDQCGKTFKNLGGLNSHKNYCAILQSRKNKPHPNEVILHRAVNQPAELNGLEPL